MGNGARIIEGLQQAVAHAKGEATGAREHVVQVPRPTLTPAQERVLRAIAEHSFASSGQLLASRGIGRHDLNDLVVSGLISVDRRPLALSDRWVSLYVETDAGRRWLAEHDHA